MKIIKLTTKNFKRLGTGEFAFADGVNIVVGPNGAGKSTLLRAVSTALFGVASLPGVASDVATWGSQSWSLCLEFEHAGVTYSVTRDHKTAKVEAGGELVANGNRPSTLYVEGLLHRSMKDFNLLSNSRQGETTYAMTYGATALQRDVERLSGADEIERIIGAAKALRTKLDAEVLAAGEYLLSDEQASDLERGIEASRLAIDEANVEVEKQDAILAEPFTATTTDPKHTRKAREAYVRYEAEAKAFASAKSDLESQLAEMGDEQAEDDSDLRTWKSELTRLQASRRKYERACDEAVRLEKQIAEIEIPEGDFDAQVACAEKAKAAAEAAEAEAMRVLNAHGIEVDHLQKHLKDGVCSACGTVLKDDVEEVKAKLEVALAQAPALRVEHDRAVNARKKIGRDLSQWEAKRTIQQERIKQKARLEEQSAAVDMGDWDDEADPGRLAEVEKELPAAEEALRQAAEHNRARRKLVDKLERLQAPAPAPEVTEADVAAVEAAWVEYQAKLSAWNVAQATAKERRLAFLTKVKEHERILKDNAERLAVHQRTLEAVKTKKEKAELAGRLTGFLRERREFYLTRVWDVVLGSATRFLVSSTDGWITGMQIKDGGFVFEERGGAWVPSVEASGAQGAFLGIALRVGLSQALDCDRSMMLLDEPTEAMTEDNARRLMAGIGAARDQVVVVTHRTTDQGLADNIIEVTG